MLPSTGMWWGEVFAIYLWLSCFVGYTSISQIQLNLSSIQYVCVSNVSLYNIVTMASIADRVRVPYSRKFHTNLNHSYNEQSSQFPSKQQNNLINSEKKTCMEYQKC